MIPYSRQLISKSDIASVNKVLKSDFLTQGPNKKKFENLLSKTCGVKYSSTFNSATSALHIACLALGVGRGDEVWTCTNSFVASANCALYCQAKIDLVDIDPSDFNMCMESLEKKLSKAKKRNKLPKVIIPIHFGGLPPNLKKLKELKKKYKFKIIEDASHALGAKYNSEDIGNCKYSDIAVFSFHPIKMITTIEGGVATTNNQKYADQMSKLRTHGIVKEKFKMKRKKEGNWYYEQNDLGLNYRMNDVQAALGLSQLKKLNKFLKRRREIAKLYIKKLKKLPVNFQLENLKLKSSYHLFVIEIQKGKKLKKKIFDILRRNNILVNVHYIPIHLQPYYMKNFGFKKGQFKLAENYYDRAISLPIYYSLSNSRVQSIINLIKKYL